MHTTSTLSTEPHLALRPRVGRGSSNPGFLLTLRLVLFLATWCCQSVIAQSQLVHKVVRDALLDDAILASEFLAGPTVEPILESEAVGLLWTLPPESPMCSLLIRALSPHEPLP